MNVKTNSFYKQAASSNQSKTTDSIQKQKNSKENSKEDTLLTSKRSNRV